MTDIDILEAPAVKPKIKKDAIILLKPKIEEESQVIIHFSYKGTSWMDKIRIWKSTFLVSKKPGHKSKLVHVENIAIYPNWTLVKYQEIVNFTLVFTGLPKDCKQFDFIESIPESGGFIFRDIQRNSTDVYRLTM